jgi:uncharacterized protein YabE (DUF348 family)
MKEKKENKKIFFATVAIVAIVVFIVVFEIETVLAENDNSDVVEKNITINDDGLIFRISSKQGKISEMLSQQGIDIRDQDVIFPPPNNELHGGMTVIIQRSKKITIREGGKKETVFTFCKNVEQAIWEQKGIALGEDDITNPSRQEAVKDGMDIKVTHVLIKEETGREMIDYKTLTKEDDKLSWRTKKVTQKGEKGTREIKYKVVYYDGKEISRKILSKEVVKEPVTEETTQGTYIKVGKAHTGGASWYAYTGTLSAANPWLPMGSYVKVTNKENGKSVIVKINDRGPFGPGRIIDLDKVAFAKIADLGQGVVNVKMEEITN